MALMQVWRRGGVTNGGSTGRVGFQHEGPAGSMLLYNTKYKNTNNEKYKKNYERLGVFLHGAFPKKLKYGKPRLGESTLT